MKRIYSSALFNPVKLIAQKEQSNAFYILYHLPFGDDRIFMFTCCLNVSSNDSFQFSFLKKFGFTLGIPILAITMAYVKVLITSHCIRM